jgi:hypothetical protein
LASLLADSERVMGMPTADALSLLARIGAVEALLRARLNSVQQPRVVQEQGKAGRDRLLTVEEVVERSKVSRRWIQDHWRSLPFAKKVGRRILFSERGFEEWLLCH